VKTDNNYKATYRPDNMKSKGILTLTTVFLLSACAGTLPKLGVKRGELTSCPASPNCVNSQSAKADGHYVPALRYPGNLIQAHTRLLHLIDSNVKAEVIEQTDDYIHATYTSTLFGFVDDVEFLLSEQDTENTTIHVRSASRLGYSDFGVNRKRVEALREILIP
jgi:uncharacterized protein (DUF1499 family)